MRIGIFGGTFNPIHVAHLRSAEEVREAQSLDRVLFVPSATPPHKQRHGLASAAHRLAMVRLAIAGNPYFRVSTVEIERAGRSYSVDTIGVLRKQAPGNHFAFILGLDAFGEIGTWKKYRDLFSLCDIIVTSRPEYVLRRLRATLPVAARGEFWYGHETNILEHSSGHRLVFQRISDLQISASAIRDRLKNQQSIRYLVPPSVLRYIDHHKLYRRGGTS